MPDDDKLSFLRSDDSDPHDGGHHHHGGGHRAAPRRRRGRGCLPMAIGTIVVLVVLAFLGRNALSSVKDMFAGPADYSGGGSGEVLFQVHPGDTATAIGDSLARADVVKSAAAFIDAAKSNARSRGIQVGYYQLREHMRASLALDVLVNPKNLVQAAVTVPEGARVAEIIDIITKHTKITRTQVVKALENPRKIGLPAAANGNPEGYLFPATYAVIPGESATQLLAQMVAKAKQVDAQLDVAGGAAKLGLTPEQVVTVASILEYEAKRQQDYPRVARAIYNRLAKGMRLQSDATVSYANGVSGQVWTSDAQRANASPYNTYQHGGLPPGPIGSPGEVTLEAALHPAPGSWLYWVVVNLRTGETVFSTTFAEHQSAVAQFQQYCKTSTAC
jgi:UPF0755 protein